MFVLNDRIFKDVKAPLKMNPYASSCRCPGTKASDNRDGTSFWKGRCHTKKTVWLICGSDVCRTGEKHEISSEGPEKCVERLLSAQPHFESVVVSRCNFLWPWTKEWMDYVFNAETSVARNQKLKVSTNLCLRKS